MDNTEKAPQPDVEEQKDWLGDNVPEFAGEQKEKLSAKNNVYREIARNALMNWNGLSQEEADQKVTESSIDELEQMVGAKGSIESATRGIQKALADRKIEWDGQEELLDTVLNGTKDDKPFEELSGKIEEVCKRGQMGDFVFDVLSTVHEQWIQDNPQKFFNEKRAGKRYQFMPLELIGYDEAMADNMFLKPILYAAEPGKAEGSESLDPAVHLMTMGNRKSVRYIDDGYFSMDKKGGGYMIEGIYGRRQDNFLEAYGLTSKENLAGDKGFSTEKINYGEESPLQFAFVEAFGSDTRKDWGDHFEKAPEDIKKIYDELGKEEVREAVAEQVAQKVNDSPNFENAA